MNLSLGSVESVAIRRLRSAVVLGSMVAVCLAGCSSGGDDVPSASDRTFAGLDAAVVEEVLASPVAQDRVAGDEPAVAAARYQGMVRNFILCRDALAAYREWVSTGVAPELTAQPVPTHPSPTAVDMDRDIQTVQQDLASGDITLLRDRLTNPSGCGAWVPATRGDQNGPTIAEVVEGGL